MYCLCFDINSIALQLKNYLISIFLSKIIFRGRKLTFNKTNPLKFEFGNTVKC